MQLQRTLTRLGPNKSSSKSGDHGQTPLVAATLVFTVAALALGVVVVAASVPKLALAVRVVIFLRMAVVGASSNAVESLVTSRQRDVGSPKLSEQSTGAWFRCRPCSLNPTYGVQGVCDSRMWHFQVASCLQRVCLLT